MPIPTATELANLDALYHRLAQKHAELAGSIGLSDEAKAAIGHQLDEIWLDFNDQCRLLASKGP